MFEISNELGQISFSKNIIYRICLDAARKATDVRIQNYKGRYTTKKPGLLLASAQTEEDIDERDIEIRETELGLVITVYVVVRFGLSMSQAAGVMMDHIYEQMEALLHEKPAQVKIVVTGTASKTIAKRNIEFSR